MKILYITIAMLLFQSTLLSQVPSYFENNPEWRIDISGDPPCLNRSQYNFYLVGDSLINDESYWVMNNRIYTIWEDLSMDGNPQGCPSPTFSDTFYGLFRQEDRKIYQYLENQEVLVMDYDLQVNDTFYEDSFESITVDSISTVNIGSEIRNQYWYYNPFMSEISSFIEGVASLTSSGSAGELFGSLVTTSISAYNPSYICFSQNSSTEHVNPTLSENQCYFDISISEMNHGQALVYPNPTKDLFYIYSPLQRIDYIEIVSIVGSTVQKEKVLVESEPLKVLIENFRDGIYTLYIHS